MNYSVELLEDIATVVSYMEFCVTVCPLLQLLDGLKGYIVVFLKVW